MTLCATFGSGPVILMPNAGRISLKKMKALGIIVLTFVIFNCWSQPVNSHDGKAIICLTYDDEIESHIKVVIPKIRFVGT